MKLSKDDLLKKVSEKVTDEDIAIELMEDISDSMEVDLEYEKYKQQMEIEKNEALARIADLESCLAEQKLRYKERFLTGEEIKPVENNTNPEEGLVEKEVIDIKEV